MEQRLIKPLIGILLLATCLTSLVVFFLIPEKGSSLLLTVLPLDRQAFLFINHHHSVIWDRIMYAASSELFWIPFYIFLLYIVFRDYGRECWRLLLTIAAMITASDQIASHLIKNTVRRLRPSHEPALMQYIHLSSAGPGGLYGFISSHAANSTALCILLVLTLRRERWMLKCVLILWAILVCYSRIYNGVHYPSDVIAGIVVGLILGVLFYLIFSMLSIPFKNNKSGTAPRASHQFPPLATTGSSM